MISIKGLSKQYVTAEGQPVQAMQQIDLSIEDGSFFVLLGPSGSGKTTTLRSIAGLEEPDEGEIAINGQAVFSSQRRINVPPEQRPIAMVFQSYALWPHMNVLNNITFPLRRGIRRVAPAELARRVDQVLRLLNLTEQAHRPISTLSGGQQQRVALARALALEPAVLLMDEPLSNLDAKLRAQLRVEIRELTRSLGITTVYVTHDQTEAMTMGDRIAVMDRGMVLQEGTPMALYQHPKNLLVARFLGEMNFLEGTITSSDGAYARVSTAAGELAVTRADEAPAQGPVWIGFRPEDAHAAGGPGENVIRCQMLSRQYLGDVFLYDVSGPSGAIQVKRPIDEVYEKGQDMFLHVPKDRCRAFVQDGAGRNARASGPK